MTKTFGQKVSYGILVCAVLSSSFFVAFSRFFTADAASHLNHGEHLITIHDGEKDQSIVTDKQTLREVFKKTGTVLDKNDIVEPGLDEPLVAPSYQVNIYRARPVTVVDGSRRVAVMTAYQTPEQITEQAGITLHDQDQTSLTLSDNLLKDGSNLQLVINRATPVKLVLFGKTDTVYTRSTTVKEFLKEKHIMLGKKDTISVNPDGLVKANMTIEIWHNGSQRATTEESIPAPIETIQDTNQPVGYEKITKQGQAGKKMVTYDIIMKNGREISRKKVGEVVVTQPTKTVKIVGAKPSFGGDFAAALAKLRSCEGGYTSWNSAGPYYGAYQFDQGTWNSVSSAPYGNATPAEQDAAARALYERRGWSPWPVCGASLPDTYR